MVHPSEPDFAVVGGVLVRRRKGVQVRQIATEPLQALHERFIEETGAASVPWYGMPAALRQLGARGRPKRLPDGTRPVVYFIPRPRKRRAEVVALGERRRA
jgi:hypothetical protein